MTRSAETKVAAAEQHASHRRRGVPILAKSLFRELTANGYEPQQIVSLAAELIGEVTAELAASSDE